ncbi:hypothetical protein [Azospirillum brasilense]|uniref:hypothetical protein n=1 Tax=Azospirillum brasilense TaxID=192 RepID=UPI000FEFD16E|nr:hypothetical protein [Azospirillum brasilense]NUB25741.1 hypothetical protein [Azospirillum brasilense]NUB33879.1 hypothetical protein [Azospirillum brasilense]RIW07747.1 hypothetical protein D2T81_02600 [Azospirillum brasilense]
MSTSEFTHSFFGHPVMAVLNLLGLRRAATWVHDVALPVPVEPVAEPTAEQHPTIFSCQILDLQDGRGTLRLEWQEPTGSGGGAFARSVRDAMGTAKEMAMLLNGEREEEPIIPVETCEAWVEREWFWWIVKYQSKPSASVLIMDRCFPLRSSALAVAAAIKTAHRDGVVLGVGGAQ